MTKKYIPLGNCGMERMLANVGFTAKRYSTGGCLSSRIEIYVGDTLQADLEPSLVHGFVAGVRWCRGELRVDQPV